MIRTIDRYVLKELGVPFLIGTVSVVLMFLANMLIAYSTHIFQKEVPFSAVGQFLVFKVPWALNMTLPVGITIASALAMSRLVRESELAAMRAAGIPVRRIVIPMLAVGAVVSLASFWLGERVTPGAEARALTTLRKIFASAEAIGLQSNVLLKLNEGEYHVSIGAVRKEPGGEVLMNDILVFQKPKRGEDWIAQAPAARYRDGVLTLNRPIIRHFAGDRMLRFYAKDQHRINLRVSLDAFFGQPLPEEQNARQLKETIRDLRSKGGRVRSYEVDYYNKFSIPAACLVFALFSPVFALYFARGGAFIGVLVSIIVVFLYYNLWVLSAQVMAKSWILPPVVGAWLPNVLFFVAGAIALWRSE